MHEGLECFLLISELLNGDPMEADGNLGEAAGDHVAVHTDDGPARLSGDIEEAGNHFEGHVDRLRTCGWHLDPSLDVVVAVLLDPEPVGSTVQTVKIERGAAHVAVVEPHIGAGGSCDDSKLRGVFRLW